MVKKLFSLGHEFINVPHGPKIKSYLGSKLVISTYRTVLHSFTLPGANIMSVQPLIIGLMPQEIIDY